MELLCVPFYCYLSHSCYALTFKSLQQIGFGFVNLTGIGDHVLGAVQAPLGCDTDGQIGNAGLRKEFNGFFLATDFNKDSTGLSVFVFFFSGLHYSPMTPSRNLETRNTDCKATRFDDDDVNGARPTMAKSAKKVVR